MKSRIIAAQDVVSKAISNGTVSIKGDADRLASYLGNGVGGNCGFIVDGDIEKFAKYLVMSAAGQCGAVTADVAGGQCGFTINGDYELAWSNQYFQNIQDDRCGFVVESAKL